MFKIVLASLVAFQTINAFQSVKAKLENKPEKTYDTKECIKTGFPKPANAPFHWKATMFECKNKDSVRVYIYQDEKCNDDKAMRVFEKGDEQKDDEPIKFKEFNCKGLPKRDGIILIISIIIIVILIIIGCVYYYKRNKTGINANNDGNYPNV
mmetsp:Transcript_77107/g.94570  ORF Transcript_77107/g.94570 Transcript_77107/m.94570 type:complete len:153 (+) Transcript_77107:84-542(+)